MAPRHEYRAIVYQQNGKPKAIRPKSEAEDTPEHMDFMLEHYVQSGYATGGHVEVYVRGIGWVVDE